MVKVTTKKTVKKKMGLAPLKMKTREELPKRETTNQGMAWGREVLQRTVLLLQRIDATVEELAECRRQTIELENRLTVVLGEDDIPF
jgi:hypothetical protein